MSLPAQSPDLNPSDLFLWDSMNLKVHHTGTPEARHQSSEAIN